MKLMKIILGSSFHRQGAAYREELLVIFKECLGRLESSIHRGMVYQLSGSVN